MGFAFILESVGGTEWFVLLGVILIVVGPKNLPAAARKLGQVMTNLRRAADEFKRQLMSMDQEVRNTVNDAMSLDSTSSSTSSDPSSSSESSDEDRASDGGDDLYSDDNPYPGHDGYYDENYGEDYGNGLDEEGAPDGDDASGDAGESSEPSAPAQPPPPSDEELRRVTITVSSAPRKGT